MKRWLIALALCAAVFAASLALVLLADRRLGVAGPYNIMVPPFVVMLLMWAVRRLVGTKSVAAFDVVRERRSGYEADRTLLGTAPSDTVILLHTRRSHAAAPAGSHTAPGTPFDSTPAHGAIRS